MSERSYFLLFLVWAVETQQLIERRYSISRSGGKTISFFFPKMLLTFSFQLKIFPQDTLQSKPKQIFYFEVQFLIKMKWNFCFELSCFSALLWGAKRSCPARCRSAGWVCAGVAATCGRSGAGTEPSGPRATWGQGEAALLQAEGSPRLCQGREIPGGFTLA